jgi:flavin-dependent dehydrogenase
VIIGGGPAGSSAGFHLARAGISVTIIESKAFPRVKVCGEYISPAATDVLEQIIPEGELLRAGARRVDELVIEVGDNRRRWPTPRSAWSLSRAVLDSLLLNKAQEAGAEVVQPGTVRSVAYSSERVDIQLADGGRMSAALVVHADGSGRHDPAGPVPVAPRLLGYKCHLRMPGGVEAGITMRSCRGAYLGTIAVEMGLGTCALVATRALAARFGRDVDAMVSDLWPAYRRTRRESDWQACGVPRSGYTRPGHPRSLRIGNAAAAVDPVGGEGIGLAIWSGTRLARHLANSPALDARAICGCERRLGQAYRARLRLRRPACRLMAEVLMRPAFVRMLWPSLGIPVLSLRTLYLLTGKPA